MMNVEISPRLFGYLRSWFKTSTEAKAKADVTVELTFDQFIGLFDKRQLASLQKRIDTNSIRAFMDEKNAYAYVLTWVSYAACSTRVFSKETACVCSRMKSGKINLPALGDNLRPDHKEKIGKGLKGKPKTDEHRQNISEGSKGQPKAGWTEQRKADRRALRQAQEAAKKAGAM